MKAMPLFKKKSLVLLISCLGGLSSIHNMAYASIVREDVDYQDFRDFAENKGRFTVGTTNIQVHDKDGKLLGEVIKGQPMPDWSSVSTTIFPHGAGVSTLTDPQYVASVAHNGDHRKANFGVETYSQHNDAERFDYMFVNMNNHPKYNFPDSDYQTPRLHKLVTEVVPVPMADVGSDEDYTTNQKYSAFARIGTGTQGILSKSEAIATTEVKGINKDGTCSEKSGCTEVYHAYEYLTGGELLHLYRTWQNPNDHEDIRLLTAGEVIDKNNPNQYLTSAYTLPLTTFAQNGDSGSPAFAYNKVKQQWEIIGVISQGVSESVLYNPDTKKWELDWSGKGRTWAQEVYISAHPEYHQQLKDNKTITIQNNQSDVLTWQTQNTTSSTITQANSTLKHTVPLVTQLVNSHNNVPDAKVTEVRDLDTGKTLHFTGQDGTLELTSSINQGAGALYFDNNFTVRTTNPADTWLGAGVSVAKDKTVTWQVKNPENDRLSKIGEGTLLVNGVGENKGDISVGDGTVILNQQADSTGKKQAFNKVGIVSGRATVKLMDSEQIDPNKLYFGYRGGRLDLNGNNLTFNYIRNFDQGARLVNHHPSQKATITVLGDDTKDRAFNGVLGESDNSKNGQLDVVYNPTAKQQQHNQAYTWLLSGGSQLNGNLTVQAGTVFLSGRPTPHAYDLINQKEVIKDDSWLNRSFTAQNFNIQGDGQLQISRNVTNVTGNINAQDQATVKLGYQQGDTVCIRSDYHGGVNCNVANYTDNVLNSIPSVQFTGNLNLKDNSQITLGKAHMTGSANASQTSQINLSPQAHWTMTNNSQVGNLAMTQGSQITLNTQPNQQYNTLTITGNLTGAGQFNYLTNLTKHQGDKVVVQGTAEGQYGLYVQNSGTEPVYREQHLTLLSLQNANQTNKQVNVELLNPNKTVDLGAYRYTLENNGQDYYLYNPYLNVKDLNVKEITKKGDSVKADSLKPYEGEISTKGSGVTHELPVGHLEMKGESVKAEPLPVGHLEMKGESVKAEPLPVGHLEMKGESVKAEPLPAIDIQKVLNTQHSLPAPNLLPQSAVISRYANTALSDWSAQAQAVKLSGQAISKKLQSLKPEETGLWTHIEYENNKNSSNYHRDYEQHNRLVQFGVDKGINTDWGHAIAGVSLSYVDSDASFDDGYKSDGQLTLLSTYGKVQSHNGLFATADIGYGRVYDKIRAHNDSEKADVKRNVVMAGTQLGKTWDIAGIQVTPTVGLRYIHLAKNRYSLNHADVDTPKLNLMTYETGVELGKTFVLANGTTWKPSISASYSDSNRQKDMYVNGHQLQQRFGQSWNTRVGLDMRMKRLGLAFNAGYSDGKDIGKQKIFSIGSSYSW